MSLRTYHFVDNDDCCMCASGPSRQEIIGQRLNRSQGFSPSKLAGVTVAVQKCLDCGLIAPNPLPMPQDLTDHYGVPPENYWAQVKFEEPGHPLEREVLRAKELLAQAPNMRALDIGAGLGRVLGTLERHGFEAHGLEPSEPFHAYILANAGVNEDRVALSRVEDAEYPPEWFDFITFGAVLEHLFEPHRALERALGWLKPGGIIHIEVPSSGYLMARLLNAYFRLRGSRHVTNLSPMHTPYHLYEFELASFLKHGVKAGYEVARHDRIVGTIYHVPAWLDFPFRKAMEWTGTGMQLVVYLRKTPKGIR